MTANQIAGDLMRECRSKCDQTQEQFASRLDIKQSRLSQIESGHYPPSVFMLARACELAGGRLTMRIDYDG